MKIVDLKKAAYEKILNGQEKLAVEMLLCDVLGISKERLFLDEKEEVVEDKVNDFWLLFDQFLGGKPVAQLLGKKEFYGYDFYVNDNVLIPRPETEMVVDLASEFIKKHFSDRDEVRVLDVGSGSGCIIESLVKIEPKVMGLGLEISEQAIEVARKNAKFLEIEGRVDFRHSDLLGALGNLPDERFDLVLANLPYIGTERFNFVARDVAKYEPAVALFGGVDGLDLYRKLFGQLMGLSWRPARVIGEFGFGQDEEMRKILEQFFGNLTEFEIIPDLAGIPRIFVVDFRAG